MINLFAVPPNRFVAHHEVKTPSQQGKKIYHLVQYFGIFSKGMHRIWPSLNYIEICSGPGRCITRNNGQEINGTALSVLKDDGMVHIDKAIFIDYNSKTVDILNQRITNASLGSKAKAICGDFTNLAQIRSILSSLNQGLNLVLVDPTECNVPFSTLHVIAKELNDVDFIVNVPIGTDLKRNLRNSILKDNHLRSRNKYSRFLGDDTFLDSATIVDMARNDPSEDRLLRCFMGAYEQAWKRLGYTFLDYKSVEHYYKLMFASKHPTGLKFWQSANKYDPDGQTRMF